VRAILGGNAIRILGLDEKKLNAIAERIGIPESAIFGDGPTAAPALVQHFHRRGQYLADAEAETRIPEIQSFVQEDLWRARAIA
jgi:hypothetical protein